MSTYSLSQVKKVLGPVFAVALLTVILAGCSQTGASSDGSVIGSSSSDASIVNDASSSTMDQTSSSTMDQSSSPTGQTTSEPASSAPATQDSSSAVSSAPVSKATSPYKDGTYSAMGTYRDPSGSEQIQVSVTLKNGIVTDSAFQGYANFGRPQMYQARFSQGFKEYVVGIPIDSVSLGVVNGSSLTPMGFMDALEKIKTEARA